MAHDAHVNNYITAENADKIRWKSENITDIILYPQNNARQPDITDLINLITRYADYYFQSNISLFAKSLGFDPDRFYKWIKNIYKPRFDLVLEFAYRLDQPLLHTLHNHGTLTHPDDWRPGPLPKARNVKNRTKSDHLHIEKRLNEIIKYPPEEFPSIPMICKDLNCSPGYLNHRFPKLKKILISLRKSYIKSLSITRRQEKKR